MITRVRTWWSNPWRRPMFLAAGFWLYVLWSLVPVLIAIQFAFNDGRSRSTWQGFSLVHDPELLAPYVERYHESLTTVWSQRTHAIAESIVEGFYPMALADQRLLDASQAWLDAHPDSPDGLVRLVSENRDAVARALRAQACDAAAGGDGAGD